MTIQTAVCPVCQIQEASRNLFQIGREQAVFYLRDFGFKENSCHSAGTGQFCSSGPGSGAGGEVSFKEIGALAAKGISSIDSDLLSPRDQEVLGQLSSDLQTWENKGFQERGADRDAGAEYYQRLEAFAWGAPRDTPKLFRGMSVTGELKVGQKIDFPLSDWATDKRVADGYAGPNGKTFILPAKLPAFKGVSISMESSSFHSMISGGSVMIDKISPDGKTITLSSMYAMPKHLR